MPPTPREKLRKQVEARVAGRCIVARKAVYTAQAAACPDGEIGRRSGLKIRRFPEKGRAGSIPAPGTSLGAATAM